MAAFLRVLKVSANAIPFVWLPAPCTLSPPTTHYTNYIILYIKRSAAYLHFHCAGLGECKMDIGHTAYKECFCGTGLITKDAVCVCMRWERSRASIPVLPLRPRDVTSIIILCPSDAKNESRANIWWERDKRVSADVRASFSPSAGKTQNVYFTLYVRGARVCRSTLIFLLIYVRAVRLKYVMRREKKRKRFESSWESVDHRTTHAYRLIWCGAAGLCCSLKETACWWPRLLLWCASKKQLLAAALFLYACEWVMPPRDKIRNANNVITVGEFPSYEWPVFCPRRGSLYPVHWIKCHMAGIFKIMYGSTLYYIYYSTLEVRWVQRKHSKEVHCKEKHQVTF